MENSKFKVIEKITDVVNNGDKKSYRYYSILECKDCGHRIKITSSDLKRRTECKECNLKNHKESFIGYENEMYKVISFSKQVGKRLFYVVKCKKCNNVLEMRKDSITDGAKVSCVKCKGNGIKPSMKAPINAYMYYYMQGAKSRGFLWNLTLDQFKDIISKNCFYCNSKPMPMQSLARYNKTTEKLFVNGVDRIDSNKGYELNNCVSCCSMCNKMKQDFSQSDFFNKITKIYETHMCSTTIETTE